MNTPIKVRTPAEIAAEIKRLIHVEAWRTGFLMYARPYVDAMTQMTDWKGNYGADSVLSVALYALNNLQAWHGQDARRIKTEIKQALKTECGYKGF